MVSVVIATLGGDTLRRTIEQLNRGTLVPTEILIAIPEREAPRARALTFDNVRVVATRVRGQVAQRAEGFRAAAQPFVLQIDDDMLLRPDALQKLVDFLSEHPRAAVAPMLHDKATGKFHAFLMPRGTRMTAFERLLFWVINGAAGYQPGRMGISGVNMGIPEHPLDWHDVDWLSGGCVLHRREDLELENFYPFPGKAFAEDLFHSERLRRKGIRLMRCGAAVCDGDFRSSAGRGVASMIRDSAEYGRRMARLVRERRGSVARLVGYLLISPFNILRNKLGQRRDEGRQS